MPGVKGIKSFDELNRLNEDYTKLKSDYDNSYLAGASWFDSNKREIRSEYYDEDGNRLGTCDKIYYFNEREDSNEYKETYDFWLTSLIFNCLIMVLYLGLDLFGFLIFKESSGSGGSGGVVSIK